MATNFPGSLDNSTSLPYPTSTSDTNSPSLAGGQDNQNDAVIATQNKLGIGSSTATTNSVLVGTGSGQSNWQLLTAANVTLSTGSGGFVLASTPTITSPTLTTPTINNPTLNTDSVIGYTVSNNGTVYGMSVSGGVLNSAAILGQVNTAAIQANAVTAPKLATNAIFLGATSVTSNSGTLNATTTTAIAAFSTTVTIPAGGRTVEVELYLPNINPSTELNLFLSIWTGTVGSGTQIQGSVLTTVGSNANTYYYVKGYHTPSAGSLTYNVGYSVSSGNVTYSASATSPAFLIVKAI